VVKDLQGSLGDVLKSSASDLHLDGVEVTADEPYEDQHLRELDAKQDGRPVHVQQSAWSHGGKAYLFTFIADAANYEETRILAEAMINSFRFL
jgi:hypothetical protein